MDRRSLFSALVAAPFAWLFRQPKAAEPDALSEILTNIHIELVCMADRLSVLENLACRTSTSFSREPEKARKKLLADINEFHAKDRERITALYRSAPQSE